jgi:hypothetical protein
MLALWTLSLLLSYGHIETLPDFLGQFILIFGGASTFQTALTALLIIHALMAAVTVAMGLYARMPLWAVGLWAGTVLVFGTVSMQNMMKVAARYAVYQNPVLFGMLFFFLIHLFCI